MTCGSSPGREPRAVVIGVGNPFRRDDGVGEAVVSRILARMPAGPRDERWVVALDGEPARIVETWAGAELAVVVDAVCSDAEPGTVERVNVVPEDTGERADVRSRMGSSPVSGHAAGVAEAVALGAALGRLPRRLVIYTVAADDVGNGPGLSPRVEAAVDGVVGAVADLVAAPDNRHKGRDNGVASASVTRARRVNVEGIVQGVGFRPFVWRLARQHGLTGWVRNRDGSVEILAEGAEAALDRFCQHLVADAPPLAQIDGVDVADVEPLGAIAFEVNRSVVREGADVAGRRLVSSDAVACEDCLTELSDPGDRRYRYPFVNCTNCGPRFTIIDDLPYDRSRTSMATFALCADCQREYTDPGNRRFHAEPVACPACGPKMVLVDAKGRSLPGDPIHEAGKLLRAGGILAVKGLGGYQLACDATDDEVVARLRRRKQRPHKPLAVMVADLHAAAAVADIRGGEAELLASPQGPIVLVSDGGELARSVAPGHRRIGVLLPTTPLHHLLLAEVGRPLVMTSGNRSDEPIVTDDADARRRLGAIADLFLVHNRRIAARFDDSVALVRQGAPALLRRGRGSAPVPLRLPVAVMPTLAVGAELQAAFCLAAGTDAFVSPHVGDLDSDDALVAYREALVHYRRLLGIEPSMVAHDLHPDLLSTRLAETLGLPRLAVQHHHAHIVSVMAEHGLRGPVLGVAFDGFGLGSDGTAWGGEFLACDWSRAERLGHLRPVRQPGGDAAVRCPTRMALAYAMDAGCLDGALDVLGIGLEQPAAMLGGASPRAVVAQVEADLASPFTSSVGRLFDAVAALAGVCREVTHEGQPAMLLEQAADDAAGGAYPVAVSTVDRRRVVDSRPVIAAVVHDLLGGITPGVVAARFHGWLADAMVEICGTLANQTGLDTVCVAGGVWANDVLLNATADRLGAAGLEVCIPRAVPPGDGGLALGQVLVAHARSSPEEMS